MKKSTKKASRKAAPQKRSARSLKGKVKGTMKASASVSANRGPVTPLGDRVLLKPLSPEEVSTRSASGILIPETVSKDKPEQGTVIAIGPGRIGDDNEHVPMQVKVGDRVVFSKYGYDEVKVDGVEYFLVSETNILAIITK
jgi:chaperonin GroES